MRGEGCNTRCTHNIYLNRNGTTDANVILKNVLYKMLCYQLKIQRFNGGFTSLSSESWWSQPKYERTHDEISEYLWWEALWLI